MKKYGEFYDNKYFMMINIMVFVQNAWLEISIVQGGFVATVAGISGFIEALLEN